MVNLVAVELVVAVGLAAAAVARSTGQNGNAFALPAQRASSPTDQSSFHIPAFAAVSAAPAPPSD